MEATLPRRAAHSMDETRYLLGGVSRDTLERLIARGELKSFTVSRRRFVSSEEISRFIHEREQSA